MGYFKVSEVRFGTHAGFASGWNKAVIVFKGGDIPYLLPETMVSQKMLVFPSVEVESFVGQRSVADKLVSAKDRTITFSFAIYGGTEISLKAIREFAEAKILPALEGATRRVMEIRDILFVLKAMDEVK